MADFLLIHGSCHGAWCWADLVRELATLGHRAEAIDLPGAGADPTPLKEVTLELYRHAVLRALDRFDGPVILVGHSAGGYPISAAAMTAPAKIAHLVYLCAYTPESGKSMIDRRHQAPRQPLEGAFMLTQDRLAYCAKPDHLKRAFYEDCSTDQIAHAERHLSAQPILPQKTPLEVTEALRTLPKSYIRCSRDGAIPAEFQASMCDAWPEMARYDLDSDHSPFLSRPGELANLLHEITKS